MENDHLQSVVFSIIHVKLPEGIQFGSVNTFTYFDHQTWKYQCRNCSASGGEYDENSSLDKDMCTFVSSRLLFTYMLYLEFSFCIIVRLCMCMWSKPFTATCLVDVSLFLGLWLIFPFLMFHSSICIFCLYFWLVVWNFFSHMLGIIITFDFHIFQRGLSNHQAVIFLPYYCFRVLETEHILRSVDSHPWLNV